MVITLFAADALSDRIRYGDYQKFPEEPAVGSPAYAQSIYDSWDPNWRTRTVWAVSTMTISTRHTATRRLCVPLYQRT